MELFIGLMSGTSMDGIDAVLVEFTADTPKLVAKHSAPIPDPVRDALLELTQPGENELHRAATLDSTLARLFADAVHKLLKIAGAPPNEILAIGSHGQTIRHAPTAIEPYTVQIGNPSLIAELTGILTVADFRRRDMAAGGHAAPLAPAFHNAFLRRPGEFRTVVNIGGISNITLLPADPADPVRGFDTGPGNVLLDIWAQRHLGVPIDYDGAWAQSGRMLPELLAICLNDAYFTLSAPKSTGREYFNIDWLEEKLAIWNADADTQDIQATLVELTARSISAAVHQHAPETKRMLICGGGVHNLALMTSLRRQFGAVPVESTAVHGIDPDLMEAIGFAWLAKRTLNRLPGNLPEVTGARGLRILGGIYPA